jgi:hypothetical protein
MTNRNQNAIDSLGGFLTIFFLTLWVGALGSAAGLLLWLASQMPQGVRP